MLERRVSFLSQVTKLAGSVFWLKIDNFTKQIEILSLGLKFFITSVSNILWKGKFCRFFTSLTFFVINWQRIFQNSWAYLR